MRCSRALEAEAIHIVREATGAFHRLLLLYSIGKYSSVLLYFVPGKF
jgi:3'-phosphoadenosine 5'-phosphosulfate sulfotransferase (PAPS reductase)/FAD synthetase